MHKLITSIFTLKWTRMVLMVTYYADKESKAQINLQNNRSCHVHLVLRPDWPVIYDILSMIGRSVNPMLWSVSNCQCLFDQQLDMTTCPSNSNGHFPQISLSPRDVQSLSQTDNSIYLFMFVHGQFRKVLTWTNIIYSC